MSNLNETKHNFAQVIFINRKNDHQISLKHILYHQSY